jgi:TonB family protein
MSCLVIVQLAYSLTALPPLPSDTPPQLPVPVAQLAAIKSAQDVIAVSRLVDGRPAPAEMVLPQLDNRRHTFEFMRVHYPATLRDVSSRAAPIAWLYVDDKGRVGAAQLLTTSGYAALDSLSIEVLKIALFKPAQHDGKPVGVWLPFPAGIPPYSDLIAALEQGDRPLSEAPVQVAFTQKPVLLNRNQVEAAIVRIVHQLNPIVRQMNEALARAQGVGGTADVDIFIDTNGAVLNALIRKSSGNRDLDDQALNIARMMRFSPARNGESPVAVWIEVPIRFVSRN